MGRGIGVQRGWGFLEYGRVWKGRRGGQTRDEVTRYEVDSGRTYCGTREGIHSVIRGSSLKVFGQSCEAMAMTRAVARGAAAEE